MSGPFPSAWQAGLEWSREERRKERLAGERCLTCGRTDKEYQPGDWVCVDPWHGDDHLRAKAALSLQKGGKP